MNARRVLLAALGFVALLGGGPLRSAAPPDEYEVKAVYLFNFGKFVEWPASAFPSEGAPFVIGILGADPFGPIIDQVTAGESVGDRPIVVKRFRDVDAIGPCNILFVGRREAHRLRDALSAVRGRGVLTVTDAQGAERYGAIIVLYNQQNRIRMRINLPEARASELVISSKLLRPAEVIGGES